MAALDAAGVPVGKVRSVPEALAAAAAAGRPATVEVAHPTIGALELVASPIWRDGDGADAAAAAAARPAHGRGARGAGRSREEVEALAADGTVLLGGQ